MQSGVHAGAQPHASYRKFSSMRWPWGVCATSGWNCTPKRPAGWMLECGSGRVCGDSSHRCAFGRPHDGVTMAHPDLLDRQGISAETTVPGPVTWSSTRPVLRQTAAVHLAAQFVGQELRPVADAQHRNPQRQDLGVEPGGTGGVHRLGSAAEDQPGRLAPVAQVCRADVVRDDLAVDAWPRAPAGRSTGRTGRRSPPPARRQACPAASLGRPSQPHADALVALQGLALGGDRRRHHHVGLLQLLESGVAACAAIVVDRAPNRLLRPSASRAGPKKDLLQRPPPAHVNTGPAGQGRMRCGHPPVVAPAGGFGGRRQR